MVAALLPVRKRKRWLACSGLAFMFLVTAGFFLADCTRGENWPPERVTFSGREYASNGNMVSPDEVKRMVMIGSTSESQLHVFVPRALSGPGTAPTVIFVEVGPQETRGSVFGEYVLRGGP